MSLKEYRRKRNFGVTPEPNISPGESGKSTRRFVIQKHAARRLHFDLRLELGRTLVSWAVPKGIPLRHREKRLAVKVENHPLSYANFEGTIPKGEYGGGTVQIWDEGTFQPLSRSPLKDLKEGKLHFTLSGRKLSGEWVLVEMQDENQWLLIRAGSDHPALSAYEEKRSARTERTMDEITEGVKAKTGPNEGASRQIKVINPMKARLVKEPLAGQWLYELKFDGFRAVAYRGGGGVTLLSRTRNDLTAKFPEVAQALTDLPGGEWVMDGEIVALDAEGRSSFQLLQRYELGEVRPAICYYAFDLLVWKGERLLGWPLEKRKEKLRSLLPVNDAVLRFSAALGSDAEPLLEKVSDLGLEGLIGKRAGSFYEPGRRSGAWVKLKLLQEQEFVIGGYTAPEGTRRYFGALLVGYFQEGKLLYAGKVGSGFSHAVLKELYARFQSLSQKSCPFDNLPESREHRYGQAITTARMKQCHWLKPECVAQVRFAEWTRDDRLRHPVFLGLREDKPPKKVMRERPS